MNLLRALLALTLLVSLSGSARARDWPEPGGGSLNRNATASFNAPQVAPAEHWRVQYDELLGEPVVSGDVIHVATRRKGTCRLVALDVGTGREIAAIKIKAPAFAHVSVRSGTVVVVTSSSLTTFKFRKGAYARTGAIVGSFRSAATLLPGVAAVAAGEEVRVYDLRSGEILAQAPSLPTKPVAMRGEDGVGTVFVQSPPGPGKSTGITRIALTGLGSTEPKAVVEGTSEIHVPFATIEQSPRLIHIDRAKGDRLLVASDHSARTTGKGLSAFFIAPAGNDMPAVQSDPCIWKGMIYGRNGLGALVAQLPNERHKVLIPKKERPVGAVDGPITCANGVLLLGNYAYDIEGERVTWVAPKMALVGRLIPAGDGLVVYHAGQGLIVLAGQGGVGPVLTAAAMPVRATTARRAPVVDPGEPAVADAAVSPTVETPSITPRTTPVARAQSAPPAKGARTTQADPVAQAREAAPSPKPTKRPVRGSRTSAKRVAKLAGSVNGIVLVDGSRIRGAVEVLEAGRVRLRRKGREPVEYGPSLLCAIETSDGLRLVGPPYGLVIATRTAIDRTLGAELADVVGRYARSGFSSDATRLLREVSGRGIAPKRLAEIEELVASAGGLRPENRQAQLASLSTKEADARETALAAMFASVTSLNDAQLGVEASALLSGAKSIWPSAFAPADVEARIVVAAQPLIPENFPWSEGRRVEERWLDWARELAPSRARFANESELPDLGPAGSIWRRGTVVVRSRNLLVVSRSTDPHTVGRCVSRGEATVRAIAMVLGDGPRRGDQPLQIWIHRNRREYIGERFEGATQVDEASLGFYAPELGASRFHVPAKASTSNAARGLEDVLASVLTHQYLAERWHALDGSGSPPATASGHWAVAGLARFIEDQGNQMGQLRIQLDGRDVPSLQAATILASEGELLELATFFDHSHSAVAELSRVPIVTVKLGTPPVAVAYSTRSIFDDQAAALVFHLLHHDGQGGRRLFREVLLDHCRAETDRAVWRTLGFETSGALDEAFRAFLIGRADPK